MHQYNLKITIIQNRFNNNNKTREIQIKFNNYKHNLQYYHRNK